MLINKSECFDPPSTIRPSGTHFPGRDQHKIDIRIELKSILFYFNISIIYSSNGERMRGRDEEGQEALAEIGAYPPSVSV